MPVVKDGDFDITHAINTWMSIAKADILRFSNR